MTSGARAIRTADPTRPGRVGRIAIHREQAHRERRPPVAGATGPRPDGSVSTALKDDGPFGRWVARPARGTRAKGVGWVELCAASRGPPIASALPVGLPARDRGSTPRVKELFQNNLINLCSLVRMA